MREKRFFIGVPEKYGATNHSPVNFQTRSWNQKYSFRTGTICGSSAPNFRLARSTNHIQRIAPTKLATAAAKTAPMPWTGKYTMANIQQMLWMNSKTQLWSRYKAPVT